MSPLGKSGHSVLELKLNCMSIEEVSTSEKNNYNKGDYIRLKESLNKDFDVFKDCKNEPDILWEKFMETYNQSVKSYIPIKKNRKCSQKMYPDETTVLIYKKHRCGKDILKQKMT